MKNLKLAVVALLVSGSTLFAQETMGDPQMSDSWTTRDVIKMEAESNDYEIDEVTQLVITEVYTPVMLDPEDRYKLNQDIIYLPTQVRKTMKLDYDADDMYDKEIEFNYKKSENFDFDFTLTKDGIIILTDKDDLYVKRIWDKNSKMKYSNIKTERIKKEGDYIIELTNGEKIDIKISNYELM